MLHGLGVRDVKTVNEASKRSRLEAFALLSLAQAGLSSPLVPKSGSTGSRVRTHGTA